MGDTAQVHFVRVMQSKGRTQTGNAQATPIANALTALLASVTKANVEALEVKIETSGPEQYAPQP